MFLRRLSAVVVIVTCFGWTAMGAAPDSLTAATNTGKEKSVLAPQSLSVDPLPKDPLCHNDANGAIMVSIGSGTAPYHYRYRKDGGSWTSDILVPTATPPTFTISGLTAGIYEIYVYDSNGNYGQTSTTLNNPTDITVSLNSGNVVYPLCSGETGTLDYDAAGGVAPYSYQLKRNSIPYGTANGNGYFTSLPGGMYTMIVTDENDCSANYNGTITFADLSPIAISATILSEIKCDNTYASVQIINLPTDPFDIVIKNTTNNRTNYTHTNYVYSNLDAGNYEVTVTRRSCPTDKDVETFTIEPFTPVSISTSRPSPVALSCSGDLTDLSVTINGGNPSRQVQVVFDNNDGIPSNDPTTTMNYRSSFSFTDLPVGTYSIRWTDAKYPTTCYGSQTFIISAPLSPVTWGSDPVGVSPLCNGGTGTIQPYITGGTIPYTYYVDGSVATLPLTKVAGSYAVYVKDANGCTTEEKTVTIASVEPLVVTYSASDNKDVTCPKGSDGEINMTVSGGAGGYVYDLTNTITSVLIKDDVQTSSTVSIGALSKGTYDVLIKDQNGCLATPITNIDIDAPDTISISLFELAPIVCNGETASLNVQAVGGSNPTMTYSLYKGTTLVETKTNSGVVSFSDLLPGSYTLSIWSDLNCAAYTKRFDVEDRRKLVVLSEVDTLSLLCSGNNPAVTLTVSGEAPYTYSIVGASVNDIPFSGGEVTISSGLIASTTGYQNRIIVTDKYGCQNDIYITFIEPTPIVVGIPVVTPETCKEKNDGKVSLEVSGGTPWYEVMLGTIRQTSSDGLIEFYNVPTGTYDMTIKDMNGCYALDPPTAVFVGEPDEVLSISYEVTDPILCAGELATVKIDVAGGWGVDKNVWLTGNQYTSDTIPSGSSIDVRAGGYTIWASNADGCKTSKAMSVSQPTVLRLQITDSVDVSCNGFDDAKITIKATGGTQPYSYDLNNGTPLQPFTGNTVTIDGGIEAGTYNIMVVDNNFCSSNVVPVTIDEPDPVEFSIRQGYAADSVTCYGRSDGKFVLSATGGNLNGYKAYITPPSGSETLSTFPTISGLSAGIYSLRVSDNSGCFSTAKIDTVGQPTEIVISEATIIDSVSCFNDQDASIQIDASGGLPYSLQYKVTGKDYQSNSLIENLDAGDYDVFVRNSKGNCEAKSPVKIHIINPDKVVVSSIDKTDVSCHNLQDGEVDINAAGGTGTLNYSLVGAPVRIAPNPNTTGRFGLLGELSSSSNASSSTYNYKVEDRNGCNTTGQFTISNPSSLTIDALDDHQVYCNNQSNGWILVKANGGVGSYTYMTNPTNSDTLRFSNGDYSNEADSRIKILKLSEGNYQPMVIDGNGCTDTVSVPITIINPPPLKIANVIAGDKRCYDSDNDSTIITLDEDDCGTRGTYIYTVNNWERTITTKELEAVFVNLRDTLVYAQVKDTMGCIAKWENLVIEWPDPFNVTITQIPITCWDNQNGALAFKFEGGVDSFYVGINDVSFVNGEIFEKDKINAVTVDTIKGNSVNNYFRYDVKTDIYVKDGNDCIALNTPNTNVMNPYLYKSYTWEPVDTFEVVDIMTKSPNCNYEDASITFVTNEKGDPAYSYWAQYQDRATAKFITVDSTHNSMIKVPSDKIIFWNVADKNKCIARVDSSIFPQGNKVFIPAHSDTIEVIYEINDDERPKCPLTKDGIVRIDVKGFAREGVEVNIYKSDSTYTEFNLADPDFTYLISPSERDSFYYYEKVNELTGEIVTSDTLYVVRNDSIDFLFTVGFFHIEYIDVMTGCWVSTDFEITPQDTICPDNYELVFSPNGDSYNDEWILNDLDLKNATLKVFNSEGELVYHFPKGGLGFAYGGLKWGGFDDNGRPVPAGTYMYVYYMDAVEAKAKYGTITLIRGRD